MTRTLQTLATISILAALAAPAHAALGPSLAGKVVAGEQLDVVILLNSGADGPLMAARKGKPAAYHQTRTEIELRNTTSVADFLALSTASSIELTDVKSYWLAPFVAASIPANDLARLANLPGVAAVIENAPVELVAPMTTNGPTTSADATYASQNAIGVRGVWQQGLTGKGVLVASIDTGVDGKHTALAGRYRGLHTDSASSWLDPFGGGFPNDPVGHGTHTMGTVLGRDGIDTIGIAPDAEWIAAGVVDRGLPFAETLRDLLDAFEWLADPDGNPATRSDVPDVVLNSWGIPQGILPECDNTFWQVVDNLEALGAVVIFAAGNEGPALGTLRLPADRGDIALSCFAVGAVDAADPALTAAAFSSRGPVSCNPDLIKPELMAPGMNIRSAKAGGGYKVMSGTSMAAPHVVGAVALMRQYNPDATPQEIKQALIESARDLGTAGPDYVTGYGLLDIQNAIGYLPKPKPVAWQWNVPSIAEPGTGEAEPTIAPVQVVMQNLGRSFEGVRIEAATVNADDRLADQTAFAFDYIAADLGTIDFPLSFSATAKRPTGDRIWVDLHITAQLPALDTTVRIGVQMGRLPQTSALAQHSGDLTVTASNFGRFDAGAATTLSVSTPEFSYAGTVVPFAGGLRITGAGVDRSGFAGDDPFEPATDGILTGGDGAVLSRTSFRDTRTADPTAVRFDQTVFGSSAGAGDYVLYAYQWQNDQAGFAARELSLGAWFVWDLPGVERLVFSDVPGAVLVENGDMFVGAVLIGDRPQRRSAIYNPMQPQLPAPGPGERIAGAAADAFAISIHEAASGLSNGDFAIALVAASSLSDWEAAAQRARDQFERVSGHDFTVVPDAFELLPNYPNPFNPSTTIRYALAEDADVRVDIFNLLGQRVSTVVDEFQAAGAYEVVWDAASRHGGWLPSGVYFLRVTAGDQMRTRKMTLLR